jgi:tetratricopeptide (TPR) repeat protein
MQTAAKTSRFLTGSSKVALADSEIVVSRSGLLQRIVASRLAQITYSQESFAKLTTELVHFSEQAFARRDLNALEDISRILMSLPADAARQIGSYYYALGINRKGHRDEAEALLERIADDGPITYKARAIQTLGANQLDKGQLDDTLRFQLEALRLASDRNANGGQTTLLAHWEMSIVKSLDGDHKGALFALQSLGPLVNLIARENPFYLYAYCNDLAVGLGELGRVAEAEATLRIALASPYAAAYPNWAETRLELEAKRTSATPSVVAFNRPIEVIPAPQAQPSQKPNCVVAFWWLGVKGTALQTALIPFAGLRPRAGEARREIIEVLGRSIRSRAPPVRTE